jgi:hypothetical protein
MHKFLIAALSAVAIYYFFLAGIGDSVDETAPIATAPQLGAGSDASTAGPDDPDPSISWRMPAITAPGSETLAPSEGLAGAPPTTDREVTAAADLDERIATLWRLADHNMAQLYAVLWQTLELEGLDDADFHDFVLATLEELGDHAPGEILAALVQTAPTSALRMNALRLLAEASQELSVGSFTQALDDPDPAIRRSALAFFEELSANALLDAVADAVQDRDRGVRLVAFSTLEEMYEFTPVWDVADMVVNDPDPQIRMRALELLTYGGRQAAIDQLVLALGDPHPQVSELAGALLSEFEQAPS